MSDVRFRPFGIQKDFLKSKARIRGAFSGKRSGKTEIGSIAAILMQEKKPNWIDNKIDPYLGVIIGPTIDMTKRLSWKKFTAYAKPFISSNTISPLFAKWHDGSEVIGISADRPERLEGLKANWIWIDEVLQCSEQLFLECRARIADSEGFIICTSSLGVQYINPKQHWAYKYFVEQPDELTEYFTWRTIDNPHFPQGEISRLKESLDPRTFRAMFEIDWDTMPLHAVYSDFGDENILSFELNPKFENIIGIDWGYAHPMAVCFMQYDRVNDIFYQFDEILKSKLTLDKLHQLIQTKIDQYGLTNIKWVADVAGNQEREQLGVSNIRYFWNTWGIKIQSSRLKVLKSIAIVRSYVKNSNGRVRLFVHPRCTGTVDGFKRYSYVVKDGVVQNENPEKKDDDMCFVAGTLVETNKGPLPIEKLNIGDLVLTRFGFKRVTDFANREATVCDFVVCGRGITATPNHRFVTTEGPKELSLLTRSDILYIFSPWKKRLLNLMGSFTNAFTRKSVVSMKNIITTELGKQWKVSIGRFGYFTTEKLKRVAIYTTKMATGLIIQLRTLNALAIKSICLCTQKNITPTIERGLLSILMKSEDEQKNGMQAKRVKRGIETTIRSILPRLGQKHFYAYFAVKNFYPRSMMLNFATTTVSRNTEEKRVSTTLKRIALLVKSVFKSINTGPLNFVQRNALVSRGEPRTEVVYNITVEDVHEYIANGIVVKNCDSLRYTILNGSKTLSGIEIS